jgi:hypothetical protein
MAGDSMKPGAAAMAKAIAPSVGKDAPDSGPKGVVIGPLDPGEGFPLTKVVQ